KCDVDIPTSPQRSVDHSAPAFSAPCLAVSQRAGQTRNEHEYFGCIAEAVVPQRQPTSDVVGNMVEEDEPQRDASAGIYSQISARVVLGDGFSVAHRFLQGKMGPTMEFSLCRRSHSKAYFWCVVALKMTALKTTSGGSLMESSREVFKGCRKSYEISWFFPIEAPATEWLGLQKPSAEPEPLIPKLRPRD